MFFIAFLMGIVVSFVSSIPVGPVNIAIVQRTLSRGFKSGFKIGIGATVVEFIYCTVAVMGIKAFFSSEKFLTVVHLLSIPVLLWISYKSLTRKIEDIPVEQESKGKGDVLLGITLSFSNPFILAYWIAALAFLRQRGIISQNNDELLLFCFGVALGSLLLFYTLAKAVSIQKARFTVSNRRLIDRLIGITFLALTVYLLMNFLLKELH